MALHNDVSLTDVVAATRKLRESGEKITHLCICPMSEELIRVPVEMAVEHGFPLFFVASRNQVSEDGGGGYVMGLTQETFLRKIEEIESSLGADSKSYLRFVGVDHCGPWYKEHEKSLGEEETMASVKRTLAACIEAGYNGIHIDCSFDPPAGVEVDEAKIIKLTADLFAFAEEERKRLGKSTLSYEIGTEETAGTGISAEHFKDSIDKVLRELENRGLPRPAFVVGKTGAKIRMLENVGPFDYTAASSLPRIAGEFGLGFKEHNADYLSSNVLSLHPEYGITAANVGPCFAAAQTKALLDLANLEKRELGEKGSNLYAVMSEAVLEKAPFSKWLRKGDDWTEARLREMPAELRAVTLVTGHYVYYDEDVKEATLRLYKNLKKHDILADPERYVVTAIKTAIMRYVDAFNFCGSTLKLLAAMG